MTSAEGWSRFKQRILYPYWFICRYGEFREPESNVNNLVDVYVLKILCSTPGCNGWGELSWSWASHTWFLTGLDPDHIKTRGSHPELTYDITNIQPLCHRCHANKHSGGRVKIASPRWSGGHI